MFIGDSPSNSIAHAEGEVYSLNFVHVDKSETAGVADESVTFKYKSCTSSAFPRTVTKLLP